MIVHLDTSALIDALASPHRALDELAALINDGHRPMLSAIVLYEWLRGPRKKGELAAQESLFPSDHAVAFGPTEAAVAARLYATVKHPRGREIDLAVAACALVHNAAVWTRNREDFRDVPDLRLV